MKTSDFLYDLPESRIAQTPIEPRDHSRLMVIDRGSGAVAHRHFYDLIEYLNPGDAMVINETRVIPARLIGERPGGGTCELLLLKQLGPKKWEALARPGRRLKAGATASFGSGRLVAQIERELPDGGRVVDFLCDGPFEAALDELGEMPLPPYIREKLLDRGRYQTVYARVDGSAAAPTAGLHFTPPLMARIAEKGVDVAPVVLDVGLGTFRPVKAEDVDAHVMHSERYQVPFDAARRISAARARGNRVVAIGTTSVRTLESAFDENGALARPSGDTSIFIKPGYQFKMVDALVTNFHLPGSTLIMLVSALLGRERTLEIYNLAVAEGYRFFSFGDAMLIM